MKIKATLILAVAIALMPIVSGFIFSASNGKIESDSAGVVLNLEGPWWSKANLGPESKTLELKTGSYKPKLLERRLERTVPSEDSKEQILEKWQINSRGPWGKLSKIKIEKDKTTTLKLGGPLKLVADTIIIKPSKKDRDQRLIVSTGIQLIGAHGEKYSIYVWKNKKLVGAPKVAIIDEKGNKLATGKFEYG